MARNISAWRTRPSVAITLSNVTTRAFVGAGSRVVFIDIADAQGVEIHQNTEVLGIDVRDGAVAGGVGLRR